MSTYPRPPLSCSCVAVLLQSLSQIHITYHYSQKKIGDRACFQRNQFSNRPYPWAIWTVSALDLQVGWFKRVSYSTFMLGFQNLVRQVSPFSLGGYTWHLSTVFIRLSLGGWCNFWTKYYVLEKKQKILHQVLPSSLQKQYTVSIPSARFHQALSWWMMQHLKTYTVKKTRNFYYFTIITEYISLPVLISRCNFFIKVKIRRLSILWHGRSTWLVEVPANVPTKYLQRWKVCYFLPCMCFWPNISLQFFKGCGQGKKST